LTRPGENFLAAANAYFHLHDILLDGMLGFDPSRIFGEFYPPNGFQAGERGNVLNELTVYRDGAGNGQYVGRNIFGTCWGENGERYRENE
jgi:hypothetical protein